MVREFIYPPICVHCKAVAVRPYLCDLCWEGSELLAPKGRCLHCYSSIDVPEGLCGRCAHDPFLPVPRAVMFDREAPIARLVRREELIESFAAFAVVQFGRQRWKGCDAVVPIPPSRFDVAEAFAKRIDKPMVRLLRRKAWPLSPEEWVVREGVIEERQKILLFDAGCSGKQLLMASKAVLDAFPKKVFVLSLSA